MIFREKGQRIARLDRLTPSAQREAMVICKTGLCKSRFQNGVVLPKRFWTITAHLEQTHHLSSYVSQRVARAIYLNFAKIPCEQLGNPKDDDRFLAYFYKRGNLGVKEAVSRWATIRQRIGCYSTPPTQFVKLYATNYGNPEVKGEPLEL